MWVRLLAVPLTAFFAYSTAVLIWVFVQRDTLDLISVPLFLLTAFAFNGLLGQLGYLSDTSKPLRDHVGNALIRLVVLVVVILLIARANRMLLVGLWPLRTFALILMGSTAVAAALSTSRFYDMQRDEHESLRWFHPFRPALVPICGAACHWAGFFGSIQETLFVTYLMMGLQNALTGAFGVLQHTFSEATPEAVLQRHLLRFPSRRLVGAVVIGTLLAITQGPIQLANVLLWPFSWIAGTSLLLWKRAVDRDSILRLGTQIVGAIYFPIATICLLSLLYGISFVGWQDGGYLHSLLVLVLLTLSWRHLSYLILSLPKQLRQATSAPYVSFVVVVLAEFGALLLALVPIIVDKAPAELSLADFRATAFGLFRYADWTSWLARGLPDYPQLLTAAAGLAFNLGVAGSLLRFGQFRKTREEIEHQAYALVRAGDHVGAQKLIQKFEANSAASLMIEAAVELAKGDVESGAERVRGYIRLHRHEPTDDQVFFLLLNLAQSVSADCNTLAKLFRFAHAHKVPDSICAFLAVAGHACGCSPMTILGADQPDRQVQHRTALLFGIGTLYPLTLRAFSTLYETPALNMFAVIAPLAGGGGPLSKIASPCLLLLTPTFTKATSLADFNSKLDTWLDENTHDIDLAIQKLTKTFEFAVASQYVAMVRATAQPHHARGICFADQRLSLFRQKVTGDPIAEAMVGLMHIIA